MQQTKNNG